ncbi:hypothetical protein P691DRAFT_96103, partial [Macrolepiota fuliginosa MF-IS2]
MEQEVLSHRKGNVKESIQMNDLSGEPVSKSHKGSSIAPALNKSGGTGETAIIGGDEHDTRTKKQKMTEKIQFSALCWTIFLAGWNDGTTGPLLPRIQEVYHVGFTIVSLIFISTCLVR